MPRIDAVDISNWTAVPSPDNLNLLKGFGVRRIIVGASYGTLAAAQIAAAIGAGFDVECYGWVTNPFTPGPILNALEAAHGHPEIKRFWLDCEFTNAGDYSPESNISVIKQALALVRTVRPDLAVGIYTGGWWWTPHTNNSDAFADLPLWFGNYRNPDGVDYKTLLFGGWKDAAMWQYQDVYTAGLNTDRSLILEDNMADTYTRAEIDAKVGALLNLGVTQGGQISAIATALFDHIKNHNNVSVADTEAKVQELLDQLAQEQADLHDRIEKAGDILKGAPSA